MKTLKAIHEESPLHPGDLVRHKDGAIYQIKKEFGALIAKEVSGGHLHQHVEDSFMPSWSFLRRYEGYTIEEFL